ncbi:MAG: hypothetical protein ACK4I8_04045 [Armatimonadota bacterium]
MRQSIVHLIAGIWLIVGGVMLAVGNFPLARQIFNFLIPLTLITMGLWAIGRAKQMQRLGQTLPNRTILGEIAFAIALLLLYGWINNSIGFPRLTARPVIVPTSLPPASTTLASVLTTPVEELPKQPKLVIVQQFTPQPIQVDIAGGESFAVLTGSQNIRTFAPNSETVRVEIVGEEMRLQPTPSGFVGPQIQTYAVRLKIPKTAVLEFNGSNLARLIVRDMEGDVQVSYGGASPVISIATKGNITVRQTSYPYQAPMHHGYRFGGDELTLFPGPNSRLIVNALQETVRIYAHQPPQKEWQIRVDFGVIEVRLPSSSSVKLRATCGAGTIQIPFGQTTVRGDKHSRVYRWTEHVGTLGDGKVPVNLSVRNGNITVVLTQ